MKNWRIAIIFCLQIPRAISDDMKIKAVFFWSWFLFSSPLLRGRGGRLVGPHFIAADAQRVGDRDTDETLAGGGLRESHAALRLVAAVARLQRTTNKPISCSGKPWLGCLQTRDTQGRMEAGALAALLRAPGSGLCKLRLPSLHKHHTAAAQGGNQRSAHSGNHSGSVRGWWDWSGFLLLLCDRP